MPAAPKALLPCRGDGSATEECDETARELVVLAHCLKRRNLNLDFGGKIPRKQRKYVGEKNYYISIDWLHTEHVIKILSEYNKYKIYMVYIFLKSIKYKTS